MGFGMRSNVKKSFALTLLIGLYFSIAPAQAATGVGKAIISIGKVSTTNKDGVESKLKRRGKVFEGDTISVGEKSRLQLRFVDNQLVVLKANTIFRIDEYKFKDKDDNEKSAALSLLKGGMRSVTGLIGKSARDKYKVKTPVATMGVRGTHYVIQICSGNCGAGVKGIVGTVVQGAIVMSNDAGTQEFGADQFFNVPSNDEAPKAISNPPRVLISRATTTTDEEDSTEDSSTSTEAVTFSSPEQPTVTTTTGTVSPTDPFIKGTPAPNGALLAIAGIKTGTNGAGGAVGQEGSNALIDVATVNGVGNQPVSAILIDNFGSSEFQVKVGSVGVVTEQGGDGTLGINWGRWKSTEVVFEDDGSPSTLLSGLAFVYSPNSTTMAQLGALSGSQTYSLSAGPNIQDAMGNNLSGGTIVDVDFAASQVTDFFGSYTGTSGHNYFFGAVVDPMTESAIPVSFATLQSGGEIPLVGDCSGGSCGMVGVDLTGSAGFRFIGPNAEGAVGYFGLNGTDTASNPIGVSGAGLFTPSMMLR